MILDSGLMQRGRRTGDVMDPDSADILRRVHNMLRLGTVSMDPRDLDYPNGKVRVILGDPATVNDKDTTTLKTGFLRWMSLRGGPDTTWWAPQIGEQVLVFSPGGNLKRGIIIGSLYRPQVLDSQNAVYAQPEIRETIHFTQYADGTQVFYDRLAGLYEINCVGNVKVIAAGDVDVTADGEVNVTAGTKATITAPEIDATATTKINAAAPRVNVQAATMVHISAPLVRIDGNLLVEGAISSPSGPLVAVVPPTPPTAD